MDDTFRSYVTICSLHLYPILIRLQRFPNEEVGFGPSILLTTFGFYKFTFILNVIML